MSNSLNDRASSMRDLSEEGLLCRIREGENERNARHAASELLSRHRRQVYVWCHRLLRDHERALDLSQEVLLAAFRALPRFDGRCSVSTWLFVIARNRCLSELSRPHLLVEPEFEPDELSTTLGDPEREFVEREDEDAILALIREQLDETEQRALWMRCFECMPVDAITVALRLPDRSGARAVLQRARRKLRAALAERSAQEGGRTWIKTAS